MRRLETLYQAAKDNFKRKRYASLVQGRSDPEIGAKELPEKDLAWVMQRIPRILQFLLLRIEHLKNLNLKINAMLTTANLNSNAPQMSSTLLTMRQNIKEYKALHNQKILAAQTLALADQSIWIPFSKASADTLLVWYVDFEKHHGTIQPDLRGRYHRTNFLDDEDVRNAFLAICKSVQPLTVLDMTRETEKWLATRPDWQALCLKCRIKTPVSRSTVYEWFSKVGFVYCHRQKSYYTDGHERDDVKEYRKKYISEYQALNMRMPSSLWYHLKRDELIQDEMEKLENDSVIHHRFNDASGREILELHVDTLGCNGTASAFDTVRQRSALGGAYSELFPLPVDSLASCAYGHSPQTCKCHLPILHMGQDESIFKQNTLNGSEWVLNGMRGLFKKTEGTGMMVSAVQDEIRGFGFPITAEELALVNHRRTQANKEPLLESEHYRC